MRSLLVADCSKLLLRRPGALSCQSWRVLQATGSVNDPTISIGCCSVE